MKPLLLGLTDTFAQVRKRKVYFVFLVILQIFLLIFIAGTILFFGVRMIDNINDISESLTNNVGSADGNNGGMTQDRALQQASGLLTIYNLLKQNFIYMLISLLIILLTVLFKMWMFSLFFFNSDNNSLKKSWGRFWKKQFGLFLKEWLKYLFSSLVLIVPLFFIVYLVLNWAISLSVSPDSFTFLVRLLFYLFVPLYFFLLISFASIDVLLWKEYFKQIWFLLSKKILYCLFLLVIQIAILGIILIPVYFTMADERFFNLSLVMIFLFNVVLVFCRLWWISSIKALCKDLKEKHLAKKVNL
jgi:hypothetical protein